MTDTAPESARAYEAVAREAGLVRALSPRQLTMIALGGAIGTGLFLGSTISIRLAGPSVVISYVLGAVVAFLMARALGEMAARHPTAGSFGVHAEIYQGPWAGFTVRWSYWFAQTIAIGGEVVASGIYVRFWFPEVPLWVPVVLFSLARGGDAPRAFGRLGRRGTPLLALLASTAGMAVAGLAAKLIPGDAYVFLFGLSIFGGLYVWMQIFATHLKFRQTPRREDAGLHLRASGPLGPSASALGLALMAAIILTTWWVPGMRVTLLSGVPWLVFLTIVWRLARRSRPAPGTVPPSSRRASSKREQPSGGPGRRAPGRRG